MKKISAFAAVLALSAATALATYPKAKGAEPGVWTQDYEAATQLAAEKGLPIILNFTGSDWCPYCQIMESRVFNSPKWKSWAKDNIVCVFVDFPRDEKLKAKVGEDKIVANRALAQKHKVNGYPTYVILDSAAKKELGRTGCNPKGTPDQFIAEVSRFLLKGLEGGARAYLSPEDVAALDAAEAELAAAEAPLKEFLDKTETERTNLKADANGAGTKSAASKAQRKLKELEKDAEAKIEKLQKPIDAAQARIDALYDKAVAAERKARAAAAKAAKP